MKWEQLELDPRIRAAVMRANFPCVGDVLCVSLLDLQKVTGLSPSNVRCLLAAAAAACRPHPPVQAVLLRGGEHELRLSVGCPLLDRLLRGGLPVGGVTELFGESGAGKTQLALQLCASVQNPQEHGGLNAGAVYISTEDPFPVSRLQQLISERCRLGSDVSVRISSERVYVEHASDLDSLQVCLTRRVPLLLARGAVRLVVLDSVAALFRSEFQADDWLQRHKQLLRLSSTLHRLSQEFNTSVLCINQVTDVLNRSNSQGVSPALGLAWSNQMMVRLMMRRLKEKVKRGEQCSALRRLDVVFAPHLAVSGQVAAVWREGVRGLEQVVLE